MIDIIPENMSKNFDEDWAIFPFDQTADGKRWVMLIEEIERIMDISAKVSRPELLSDIDLMQSEVAT